MPDQPWKRNLRPATSETARKSAETKRKDAMVLEHLIRTVDRYGMERFFHEMLTGSGEDRRKVFDGLMKAIPVQIQGQMDHSLTVVVKTALGTEESLRIGVGYRPPRDVTDVEAVPAAPDPVTLPPEVPVVE